MRPRPAQAGALAISSLLLAGCVSSAPPPGEPRPTVRQSVPTAPADLQLICSAATAQRFNLERDAVLPVGSDAVAPDVFRVDVEAKNASYRCLVNRQAVILELTRV